MPHSWGSGLVTVSQGETTMTTSRYEEKQAARKARFEELAQKSQASSHAHYEASKRATAHIPFGQPILVGHHSERGHRADLKRAHNAMDKCCLETSKAEHYARKAERVGSGGISSDDPQALDKLRAKLAGLQNAQQCMKHANKLIRTHRGSDDEKVESLVALGWLTNAQARKLLEKDFAGRIGFADYQLTNNNANMKRIAARIKELESAQAREDKEEASDSYIYREDTQENRVMFLFDGKPDEKTRETLKRNGFKWSPTRVAWVRNLNTEGLYHAKVVRGVLDTVTASG